MKNEVFLSIDTVTNYYKQQHYACIKDDFILFKNDHDDDSERRFIISDGIFISIVYQGKLTVQINSQKEIVESPSIITIFPDCFFDYSDLSEDALIHSIFISLQAIEDSLLEINLGLLSKMKFTPVNKIKYKTIENLKKLQNVLSTLYSIKEKSIHVSILKSLFIAFFNQIAESYSVLDPIGQSVKDIRLREITHQFLVLLDNTYPRERGVAYYAQKLNVSPKYLSFAVKNITSFQAIKWINNMIILDAKRLLSNTELSVEKISEKLKYKSSTFFISLFKEKTGFTPNQFRKKANN